MRTLADIKRRLAPEVELVCVSNTAFPELDGQKRTVLKVQTNGFFYTTNRWHEAWAGFPAAKEVEILDADTFRWPLRMAGQTVTMRFLEAK